jgi:hypothetical protein
MPGPLSNKEKTIEPSSSVERLDIDPAFRLSRLRNRLDAVDQQADDHLLQLNRSPIARGSVESQMPSTQ